jgi:hypothetical protein
MMKERVCVRSKKEEEEEKEMRVCVCVWGGGGMKTVKEMGPSLSLSDLVGSLKERTNEILKGEKKEIQRQGERKKDR